MSKHTHTHARTIKYAFQTAIRLCSAIDQTRDIPGIDNFEGGLKFGRLNQDIISCGLNTEEEGI